tara:strand:- start:137 stop:616 length:480 start_codon:yes stop_codon:yes gene_type:complete
MTGNYYADMFFVLWVLLLICKFLWSLFFDEPLIKKTFDDALVWSFISLWFVLAFVSSRYGEELAAQYLGPLIWIIIIVFWFRNLIDWESILKPKYPQIPTPPGKNQMSIKEKQLQEMQLQTEELERQTGFNEEVHKKLDTIQKEIDDIKWNQEQDRRNR